MQKTLSLNDYPAPDTVEAELQIIADAVNAPEGFEDYRGIIRPEDFSDTENRAIWGRLCDLHDRGEELSILSLRAVAGKDYVVRIIERPVSTAIQALGHCKALVKIARRRTMYTAGFELMKAASLGEDDPEKVSVIIDKLQDAEGGVNDWRSTVFDYTSNVIQPEPLLSCCGVPIATVQNLTAISGKPKALKSTFQSAIIAACLSGTSILNVKPSSPFYKILLCDTEQSEFYLSLQCDRIFRMAGIEKGSEGESAFMVLNLRPYTPQERFAFIKKAVEDFRPDLLFIDGSADLVEDTNDLISSERLVADLLTLSSKYGLGIVTIVHSNQGGEGKIRGHLGSCLERKSETVISMEREGMGDTIKVKPRQARNKPFEAFSITINEQGDPELVSPDESPKTAEDWLIYSMSPDKKYRFSDLIELLGAKGFKRPSAQYGIKASLQKGRIIQKDKLYSLRLSNNSGALDGIPDI